MSANKFENQVHQKMNELRLQPTAQVWEEVERRIREKKRRRVIVFWFLFAGLLLAGGGAWFLIGQWNKKEITIVAERTDSREQANDQTKNFDKQNRNRNSEKSELVNKTAVTKLSSKTVSIELTQPLSKRKNHQDKELIDANTFPLVQKNRRIKSDKDNAIIESKKKEEEDNMLLIRDTVKKDQADSKTSITKEETKPTNLNESVAVHDKPEQKQTDISISDSSSTETKKPSGKSQSSKLKSSKNKWEIGIAAGFGRSRLSDGKIGLGGEKSADSYSTPSTGTSNGPPVRFADSIQLKGSTFQLGAYAKRKIGKKTAFSIGLNFSYYSVGQKTGSFKDSVLTVNNDLRTQTTSGFYKANSSGNTYHNKYYYLQIPVLIHWQINKGNKLPPLVWENGLGSSFLIGSDALVYNRSSDIFYKEKRAYNSFSLIYQTAFTARLFKDKLHPLDAGVYYNYPFSKLQKIDPPKYNYLGSYGIKLNWVIKK